MKELGLRRSDFQSAMRMFRISSDRLNPRAIRADLEKMYPQTSRE